MKKILLASLFTLLFISGLVNAQSVDKISIPCPAPNKGTFASVLALKIGDITYTPCSGRSSIFTGNVNFSGATVTGVVTGSGTATHVPMFSAASVLADTPLTWSGTQYLFQNTAGTGAGVMRFTPNALAGAGLFNVNGTSTTIPTVIDIGGVLVNGITIGASSGQGSTGSGIQLPSVGNISIAPLPTQTLQLGVSGSNGHARCDLNQVGANVGTFNCFADTFDISTFTLTFKLNRTITAAGTTGAQVINKQSGTVNFAAAASSLIVTDSIVATTSTLIATANTNDSTCSVKNAVAGSGSFTINMTSACTAETRVAFYVFN